MNLSIAKHTLVHEMFVRTADENYIAARWCAANDLNSDFSWLSLHALEKYLKAVLLLNNHPVTKQNHDIIGLFSEVKAIANSLLPVLLQKPDNLYIDDWHERSTENFIEHIYRKGIPGNRYLIYGYHRNTEDLFMLDQLVFAVRRLICDLDAQCINNRIDGRPLGTNRTELMHAPSYYLDLCMPLDEAIYAPENSPKRNATLHLNAMFAPNDSHYAGMAVGAGLAAMRNSAIHWALLTPLESSDRQTATNGADTARWLLKNVKLDFAVKKQIEAAISSAEATHGQL